MNFHQADRALLATAEMCVGSAQRIHKHTTFSNERRLGERSLREVTTLETLYAFVNETSKTWDSIFIIRSNTE